MGLSIKMLDKNIEKRTEKCVWKLALEEEIKKGILEEFLYTRGYFSEGCVHCDGHNEQCKYFQQVRDLKKYDEAA